MKIVYIADQYDTGGAADALIEMILYLRELYDVYPIVLTAHNNALADRLNKYNIENYCIGHRQFAYNLKIESFRSLFIFLFIPLFWIRYRIANIRALNKAQKFIDLSTIDIIHTNVDRNDIGGAISRKYNIPHIWHIRELTRSHFHLRFNRFHPFEYMNKNADFFVAISDSVKNDWVSRGVDERKVRKIYDGSKIENITRKEDYSKKNCLRMVVTGEISVAKNQECLIGVIYNLVRLDIHVSLDLIGSVDANYLEHIKDLIDFYNLHDNIRILGYKENVKWMMSKYDIGINPSKGEGFGRTTVEYMAAGLYTIAYYDLTSVEVMGDSSQYGYLYKNEQDLEEHIKKLFYDQKYMEDVAKRGRDYAILKFDMKRNVSEIYNLYSEVLE